jgi:hypothetical protein
MTWSIPLADQRSLGELVLVRSLERQLPFEGSHLLAALVEGLAPRLRRLLESTPHGSLESRPLTV